jgi:hypothetical protein
MEEKIQEIMKTLNFMEHLSRDTIFILSPINCVISSPCPLKKIQKSTYAVRLDVLIEL